MTGQAITNAKPQGWFLPALVTSGLWVGVTAYLIAMAFNMGEADGVRMGWFEFVLNGSGIVLLIGAAAAIPFIFIGIPAHLILSTLKLTSGRTYMSFGAVLGGGVGAMMADYGLTIPYINEGIAYDESIKLAFIWGGAFITGGSALIGWYFWNRSKVLVSS